MSAIMTFTAALGLSLGAGCCIYLRTEQQSWRADGSPLSAGLCYSMAGIAVVLSVLCLRQTLSLSSAIFTQIMLLSLLLTLIPLSSLILPVRANGRNGNNDRSSLAEQDLLETKHSNSASTNTKKLLQNPDYQTHWWLKTLCGVFLGLPLAVACSGLFAYFGPGGIDAPNKVQLVMWSISPLWMLILSLVFLLKTGWRALLLLGIGNLLTVGALVLTILPLTILNSTNG